MRERLKTTPDSISYALFVKGVGICSRGLLLVTSFSSLPESKPDDDTIFGGEKDTLTLSFPEEQHSLVRTQRRALHLYRPRIFLGDITLFSTGPDAEFYPGDPTRGWSSCTTGKTMVIDIPGNHETLFDNPCDKVIAQKIEQALLRVDAHG